MKLARIAILVGLLATLPGGGPAFGHGASKGLHVHVDPERASPGQPVTVSIDASRPIATLRIGVTGEDKVVEIAPDPPTRRLETTVPIPANAEGTVNVHAEARTVDGSTVRAAAVVTIVRRGQVSFLTFSPTSRSTRPPIVGSRSPHGTGLRPRSRRERRDLTPSGVGS